MIRQRSRLHEDTIKEHGVCHSAQKRTMTFRKARSRKSLIEQYVTHVFLLPGILQDIDQCVSRQTIVW